MTLNEAIIHAEQVANSYKNTNPTCECAKDHTQLAAWLRELQSYQQIKGKCMVQVPDIIHVLENHLDTPEAAGILLDLLDYVFVVDGNSGKFLEEK